MRCIDVDLDVNVDAEIEVAIALPQQSQLFVVCHLFGLFVWLGMQPYTNKKFKNLF